MYAEGERGGRGITPTGARVGFLRVQSSEFASANPGEASRSEQGFSGWHSALSHSCASGCRLSGGAAQGASTRAVPYTVAATYSRLRGGIRSAAPCSYGILLGPGRSRHLILG